MTVVCKVAAISLAGRVTVCLSDHLGLLCVELTPLSYVLTDAKFCLSSVLDFSVNQLNVSLSFCAAKFFLQIILLMNVCCQVLTLQFDEECSYWLCSDSYC